MRYLISWKMKEPFEDNYGKTMEIERGRIKKGEHWGDEMILPIHSYLTENKAFMIVETDDPLKLAKWTADYSGVMDWHITPVHEFSQLRKLFPK